MYTEGRDAAFSNNIGQFTGVVGGYIGGPNAFNVWKAQDWSAFRNHPLMPIWVCGQDGELEAREMLKVLAGLAVPSGSPVALDMETRVDHSYLLNFQKVIIPTNYKLLVYGSAATVFSNPSLNGYWVAEYTGHPHMHDGHKSVRGTQWAGDVPPGYDASLWKDWIVPSMWRQQ